MKRYIRASFDPSMPDWLKSSLSGNMGSLLKKKYGVALDKAKILYEKPDSSNVMPIYLLQTDYRDVVYIPGVNDDEKRDFNGRYRKLGSLAKSKLKELAGNRVVYIDLNDPNNKVTPREKYEDPRYTYNYGKPEYAGQYKTRRYNSDLGDYEDTGWSDSGKRGNRERRYRDKSGYVIPEPEDLLARYYEKFPNRITEKVDNVYLELRRVRDMIFSDDIISKPKTRDESSSIRNAMSYFTDAVEKYRTLLSKLDAEGNYVGLGYDRRLAKMNSESFSNDITRIKDDLKRAEDCATGKRDW